MPTILEKIVNNRKLLLEKERQILPLNELRQKVDSMLDSDYRPAHFIYACGLQKPFLIAEIKKASPSKGVIREDFDVDYIAGAYKTSRYVNAISVLTEPDFFFGAYDYIKKTKAVTSKPVLMKDFIIDEYQIYMGFMEGASAVLFIADVLTDRDIKVLSKLTDNLNLRILFETHNVAEYKQALDFDFDLIGINNRDLKTFVTDINTTIDIIDKAGKPDGKIIISESGINSRDDIRLLNDGGADGFLIGERFMKQKDIGAAIADLFGESNEATG
jgi:indole-3-glycerol phosphate synthase